MKGFRSGKHALILVARRKALLVYFFSLVGVAKLQRTFHHFFQLRKLRRFRQVPENTQWHSVLKGFFFVVCAQHDDGNSSNITVCTTAELLHKFKSTHGCHMHIREDDIRRKCVRCKKPLLSVSGFVNRFHRESIQRVADVFAHQRIIIDDEYGGILNIHTDRC
jgi:hypothetical protein